MKTMTALETPATRYIGTCTTYAMVQEGVTSGVLPEIHALGPAMGRSERGEFAPMRITGTCIEFVPAPDGFEVRALDCY